MAGPFDFDADEPPAPKKRRDGRDEPRREGRDEDEEADDRAARPAPYRRAYTGTARRVLGRPAFSIGAFVMVGGAALGLLSMFLGAGTGYGVSVHQLVGDRVWLWSIGALVLGCFCLRVRKVRFPAAGDYLLAGVGLLLALVFGGFQALSGYAIIDRTGLKGIGTYGLILAGVLVVTGAIGRLIEQAVRWGKEDRPTAEPTRRRSRVDDEDEDDEEPRPKMKRRPARDEEDEYEEESQPKPPAKRPSRDEDDEDDEPPPRRRRRDEDDEPPPKPPLKAKRPPRDEDD